MLSSICGQSRSCIGKSLIFQLNSNFFKVYRAGSDRFSGFAESDLSMTGLPLGSARGLEMAAATDIRPQWQVPSGGEALSCKVATSDAPAVELPARLFGGPQNFAAIRTRLADSWPSLLFTPRWVWVLRAFECGENGLAGVPPHMHLKHMPHFLNRRLDISPQDVIFCELLNKRPPAAWLLTEPADSEGSLQQLAEDCHARRTVLVLENSDSFDLVLVPRPACCQDGVAFCVFATKVGWVLTSLCCSAAFVMYPAPPHC
jgi:hypothetical protein